MCSSAGIQTAMHVHPAGPSYTRVCAIMLRSLCGPGKVLQLQVSSMGGFVERPGYVLECMTRRRRSTQVGSSGSRHCKIAWNRYAIVRSRLIICEEHERHT